MTTRTAPRAALAARATGWAGSPFGEVMNVGESVPRFPPALPLPAPDLATCAEALAALYGRYHRLWLACGTNSLSTKERYGPVDVPELLSLHFGKTMSILTRFVDTYSRDFGWQVTLREIAPFLVEFPPHALESDWTALQAVPYLLDPTAASIYLNARPAEPEALADMRLPQRHVLVVLGAPFRLEARSQWWDEEWIAEQTSRYEANLRLAAELGSAMPEHTIAAVTALYEYGGHVNGLLLSADEDGRLCDDILWMVTSEDGKPGGPLYSSIHGRISRSHLAPLVRNLAAAVAWGPWKAPDPTIAALLPEEPARFAAAVKRGAIRRRARHADLHGIHVVDLGRPRGEGPDRIGTSTRTVAPHLRQGHWRSVRVASRDESGTIVGHVHGVHGLDWHYEGRFIDPTVVNGALGEPRPTVYRIPEPAELEEPE